MVYEVHSHFIISVSQSIYISNGEILIHQGPTLAVTERGPLHARYIVLL